MNIVEGIYLEEKQSQLGTGHTASTVTFKNYYAVVFESGCVMAFLLDDDLGLTGIKEKCTADKVSNQYKHQPELQDRFEELRASLGGRREKAKAAPPPVKTDPRPKPVAKPAGDIEKKGSGNWWETPGSGL